MIIISIKNKIAIVLLIVLWYIHMHPSMLAQQMDPKNEEKLNCEEMELKETCETPETAVACQTVPYCIHCIWNTAFYPEDADDQNCNACQIVIDQGKTKTQEELLSKLNFACNIHEEDAAVFMCSEFAISHVNRTLFLDVEKADLTPHDICSLLGLCYSQFEVNFNRVNAEQLGSEFEKDGIISGKNAAAAQAKVYRIFGNEMRLNPSIWSTIPIFTPHSKSELFRSGDFSNYSCQFRTGVVRKWQMVYNIIRIMYFILVSIIPFASILAIWMIYYNDVAIIVIIR